MDTIDAAQKPVVGTLVFTRNFDSISRHTLALYCGASGDSNPIHVDSDFAKASGFPDVFAHGMLVMAYLGVALEEAMPKNIVKTFSTRFVAITQLGAAITCEGYIAEVKDNLIHFDLIARDQFGDVKLKGRASVDRKVWEQNNA